MAYLLSISAKRQNMFGGWVWGECAILAAILHKIIGICGLHRFTKLRCFCVHHIILAVVYRLCDACIAKITNA